jgi:hypothetical protein
MKDADALGFGNWASRIIRWTLGLVFTGMAYYFEDASALYVFGALFFISGFFKPKRCTDTTCQV